MFISSRCHVWVCVCAVKHFRNYNLTTFSRILPLRHIRIVSVRTEQVAYESSNTLGTVRSRQPDPVSPPRCQIRAVVVLLVLLSLTLLAGLLRFAVQHKTISMGRDVEQLVQRLKNVTEQRDSLTLCNQECPGSWDKFGCKCYFIVMGSWNKSRELCVSRGADLVVVDSKEEMYYIGRYGGDPWLGATDEASEGMWRWVDGTVLSNCLRRVWEENNLKWTDKRCEGSIPSGAATA
uniref:C-type lectin domain-containing protein n=1 Tax=Gadus morhua TaxID=8049 RepID=A0A8C5CU93_GADMO